VHINMMKNSIFSKASPQKVFCKRSFALFMVLFCPREEKIIIQMCMYESSWLTTFLYLKLKLVVGKKFLVQLLMGCSLVQFRWVEPVSPLWSLYIFKVCLQDIF